MALQTSMSTDELWLRNEASKAAAAAPKPANPPAPAPQQGR